MSRVRAVEFGIPVLVAATSGVSAVVDPDGSLRSSLEDGDSGVLRAEVAVPDGVTVASRIGAFVEVALVVAALASVVVAVIMSARRSRRSDQPS